MGNKNVTLKATLNFLAILVMGIFGYVAIFIFASGLLFDVLDFIGLTSVNKEKLMILIFYVLFLSMTISMFLIFFNILRLIQVGDVDDTMERARQVHFYGADCVRSIDDKYCNYEIAIEDGKIFGPVLHLCYMTYCRFRNVFSFSVFAACIAMGFSQFFIM